MAGTVTKGSERRAFRSLIMMVAIVAVFCTLLVGYSQYRDSQAKKAPERAATAFLNALSLGNIADAYTQLCDATRKDFTEDQFAAYVKQQPDIKSFTKVTTDLSTVNGVTSAIVVMDITDTGGSHENHSIVLSDQSDRWLVCGQPY